MPQYLNLNGERLPIGTSDLNGDTDEEEEIGPPEPRLCSPTTGANSTRLSK